MAIQKYEPWNAVPFVPFVETFFLLENGENIKLEQWQKDFFNHAFSIDEKGKLKYKHITFSTIKKSGKSACAAMVVLWYAFSGIAEPENEIIMAANSATQAEDRVYKTIKRVIEKSAILSSQCRKIHDKGIELKNGTVIKPIASEYSTAAGSNQGMSSFDELWGFVNPRDIELWTELTPPPTRFNGIRFVSTYAGIRGESLLLENIYKAMVRDENKINIGEYMNYETGEITPLPVYVAGDSITLWDHEGRMPWHTKEYFDSERSQPGLPLSGFLRIHRNEWANNVEGLDMNDWSACEQLGQNLNYICPEPPSRRIQLAVGIDASVVKDGTAVVSVFKRGGKIWLGPYKFWRPDKENPIDFSEILKYVDDLNKKYTVTAGYYDPYQLESVGQELRRRGMSIHPWSQTTPNTIKMTELLIDLLRERNIVLYNDENLKSEAQQVGIKNVIPRGRRMVKDASKKKIDSIIALSMACLAASESLPDLEMLSSSIMRMRTRRRR